MKNSIATTKNTADILKFIMSALVVATHTGLFAPHLTPVVRLAVPVFFVLSGYFFFSKVNAIDSSKGKRDYLLKSVRHNLQLYGFWFVILSPITFYIRDYFSEDFISGILSMIQDFVLGSTFQASWYITALIIGLTVLFYLSKKCSNTILVIVGVLFYIPALLSSNYLFITTLSDTTLEIYKALTEVLLLPCRNFFAGIIYLVIGKILAESSDRYCTKKDGVMSLICFAAVVGEYLALNFGSVHIKDTDCFIMLPLTAYYLCRWTLSLKADISCAVLLRKLSTLSYCSHMAVFMIVGKFLSALDIPDFGNIIVFALTLGLTWALGLIILKAEKLKAFGFLKYSH